MIRSDETGLVFYSYPGPRGGDFPYVVAPADYLIQPMIHCLVWAHPGPDIINKRAGAEGYAHDCLETRQISATDGKATAGLFNADYNFEYGRYGVTGFTLQVRPQVYGTGGIRTNRVRLIYLVAIQFKQS